MSHHQVMPTQLPDLKNATVRVLRKRKSSQIVFMTVRAHECSYQIALRKDETELFSDLKSVPVGSLMRIDGEWGISGNGTSTFFVKRAEILQRYTGMVPDKHHGMIGRAPEYVLAHVTPGVRCRAGRRPRCRQGVTHINEC